jgi:hypothetical protein
VALKTPRGDQIIKYSMANIDPDTGAATPIGEGFGQTAITGLAFVGDTLYGSDFSGNFYRIDTASGTLVLLGNNGQAQMGLASVPTTMPGRGAIPALMLLLD